MNRILLAILALFAGLATQVSPAEARVRGATEIGSVLTQRSAARADAAVPAAAAFQAQPRTTLESRGPALLPLLPIPAAPAVRTGIDRARE